MDINKKVKHKRKMKAMKKRINAMIYKLLTPVIKIEEYILSKRRVKREIIRELGRNMTMDKAVEISIKLIVEYIIRRESDVEVIVAQYGDADYSNYTVLSWLLNHIDSKNKDHKMLRYYLYKKETYDESALTFNREFTQAIYDEIVCYKGISAKWIIDVDTYGNFRSRKYEKTLIIGLED